MPVPQLSASVARLRRVVQVPEPDMTDGRLLTRFVQTGDEPAFRELVHRLGPMVLGVCRKMTQDAHLADDAFQVTFLVLARRASDVCPREAVRGWTYGVAVRTARKARMTSARRRAWEVSVATLPERYTPIEPNPDALVVLDEEVAALPDALRTVVVLCELEGLSRRETAERLGVAEGTISSRLARARKVLAERMRRRGFALPIAGLAWALGQVATAVPPRLAFITAALANGSVPVPATVAALLRGVLMTTYLTKLRFVVLAATFLAAIGWTATSPDAPVASARPPSPVSVAQIGIDDKPQPVPRPAGPGVLLLARRDSLVALSPDGKELMEFTAPKDTHTDFDGVLSRDGTRVAYLVSSDAPPQVEPPESWPFKVVIRTLGAKGEPLVVDLPAQQLTLVWAPDGKGLLVTRELGKRPDTRFECVLINSETGKTESVEMPAGVRVIDWSRDGKRYLVIRRDGKKRWLGLLARDGKDVRDLTELKGWTGQHPGRLSPDGTNVLYTDADPEQKEANKWGRSARPYLLDVASAKRTEVGEFPENAQCLGVAWSPDGKRLAYVWTQLHPDVLKKDVLTGADVGVETESFLIVADRDGKNAKTIASAKGENAVNMIFGSVDWR